MSYVAVLEETDGPSAAARIAVGLIWVAAIIVLYLGFTVALAATRIGRGGACEGPACGVGLHNPAQVLSPGGWSPPAESQLPGWDWIPPQGAIPRSDLAPFRVRVWHELPYFDRYAANWMWQHGAYEVLPPSADPDARLEIPRWPPRRPDTSRLFL